VFPLPAGGNVKLGTVGTLEAAEITSFRIPTLLMTKNSGTFQDRQNVFPGPYQSPPTFKYEDKQQLLTVHTECNPMRMERQIF